MKGNTSAHIALITLNLLYAISYFVIKSVAPDYLGANGFVFIRASGAFLLFLTIDAFLPKDKVDKKDYKKFVFAALFGVVFNQLSFFNGITYTAPNYAAIIMTTTPIIVLVISALYLKERITKNKIIGMVLGGIGDLPLQGDAPVEGPTLKRRCSKEVALRSIVFFLPSHSLHNGLRDARPLRSKAYCESTPRAAGADWRPANLASIASPTKMAAAICVRELARSRDLKSMRSNSDTLPYK